MAPALFERVALAIAMSPSTYLATTSRETLPPPARIRSQLFFDLGGHGADRRGLGRKAFEGGTIARVVGLEADLLKLAFGGLPLLPKQELGALIAGQGRQMFVALALTFGVRGLVGARFEFGDTPFGGFGPGASFRSGSASLGWRHGSRHGWAGVGVQVYIVRLIADLAFVRIGIV